MSIADALAKAATDLDDWHRTHQGELVDIIAEVWECGDEWCNCTEPQIVARFRNSVTRSIIPHALWAGEFRTDGEPGADAELAAKQVEVFATAPDMAARIRWPA